MPRNSAIRACILSAATALMVNETGASVSVNAICERAAVTKKTFYYHFPSRDDVMAAVIDGLVPYYLAKFQSWAEGDGTSTGVAERLLTLFETVGREAKKPDFKGCCFLRTATELSNFPGHPARKLAMEANKSVERWLCSELSREHYRNPEMLASQLLTLFNGLIITSVVHRGHDYAQGVLESVGMLVNHHAPHRKAATFALMAS